MNQKDKFFSKPYLIQFSIISLPPLLHAWLTPMNSYMNYFERVMAHAGGTTGLLLVICESLFHPVIFNLVSIALLLTYFFWFPDFLCQQIAKYKRPRLVTTLNIVQSLWSLFFGALWMHFASL